MTYQNAFYYLASKIQVSKTTWLLLSMKGGFEMEERGMVEIKVSYDIKLWNKGKYTHIIKGIEILQIL